MVTPWKIILTPSQFTCIYLLMKAVLNALDYLSLGTEIFYCNEYMQLTFWCYQPIILFSILVLDG